MRRHLVLVLCFVVLTFAGCNSASTTTKPNETRDDTVVSSMLRPTEAIDQAPLFELIPPAQAGIDFVHQWKPIDNYQRQLLRTAFTGGGVCLGDFNADGRCDIVMSRPHGGIRLYRNEGDFRFHDVTESAGVACSDSWTTGVAFADLNNDGLPDLLVSCYDDSNRLFINQGQEKFLDMADQAGVAFSGASVKMSMADYDRDGDLDIYLLTNRHEPRTNVNIRYLGSQGNYSVAPEHQELVGVINLPNGEQKFAKAGQADHLFKNEFKETGQLRFKDVSDSVGLRGFDHGLDVSWWDFNQDHYPDLYIANDFTDPDQFYQNRGDGTFAEISREALPNTPWFAMGSAVGDINNDGRFDLIATDMAGTTHYRQKMAMGSMDAVAWFLDTAEPRQYMRNSVFLNSGTSRFFEVAQMTGLASTDWTWSIKLADLDLDGFEDVYITNGFTRDYLNSDFNLQLRAQGKESDSLAWYNAPELREANLAFRNLGTLQFQNVAKDWGLAEVGISFGAALGDLDGDGDQDLIVNNFEGAPSVYRNRSNRSRLKVALQGTQSNREGIGAIVAIETKAGTQVRYAHPGNGFMSYNDRDLTFGLGDATEVARITVRWPSGVAQSLEDIPANQQVLITEPDAESSVKGSSFQSSPAAPITKPLFQVSDRLASVRHREQFYDDFAREPLLPNKMSQLGPGLACADVDADGDLDLFIGGGAGQPGQLCLQASDGTFASPVTEPFEADAAAEDMGCLFFDADTDGDLDLLVVSGGVEGDVGSATYQDRLYLQQRDSEGHLQWQKSPESLPQETDSGGPAAAADFDRDGDLDLFVGGRCVPGQYPTTPASHLWRNDQGHFVDITAEMSPALQQPGMVTSALWTDADADGWIDLLLATEYGPLRLFKNNSGQLEEKTQDSGLAGLLGWWNSLAAADVDRDGDIDYAAANLGLNTKYHPSKDHPQIVFYGDFDHSGKSQIVEAKKTDDGLLPVRGRSCSSNAMPFLAEKFTTYDAFAKATLPEIYTDSNLENALKVEAVMASSVLLINDGKGQFTIREMPSLAQVAPGFGMQFLYVNNDPYVDLFLAQNFYSPQRETGRMNGGMGALLLGNPSGSFDSVWPVESGVVLPDDCRASVCLDLNHDGWQDVLVATNDGPVRAILREKSASKPPLRVALKAKSGLTTVAGVRLTTRTKNGVRQQFETSIGSGYLSQTPTEIFIPTDADDPVVFMAIVWPQGMHQDLNIAEDAQEIVIEEL